MKIQTPEYTIYNDDCIKRMHKLKEEGFKADLSVFSPPFSSLYAYTNDLHDMGNSKESDDEFKMHFRFFANAIFPLIKEGRNMCVHVQNPSRSLENHGRRGIWDMRGEMIRIFEQAGFWYYGEVSIFKNPQAQSIRTKAQALTFSQFIKDSAISRPALLDYLMIFKVPSENKIPCTNEIQINEHGAKERTDVTNGDWIEWANGIWSSVDDTFKLPYPVWFNVNETNTLNKGNAREEKDEKHICPLQLDLIERCVKLWSNEGETVFSPFGGIGSEGYMSVLNGRKSVSIELKESYFNENEKNHKKAVKLRNQMNSQFTFGDL
jgi:DNA modification methylase